MVALRALKNGSSGCARKTNATYYHSLKATLLILITDDKSVDIFTSVNENQGVPAAHFSGALDPLNNKGLGFSFFFLERLAAGNSELKALFEDSPVK